MSNPRNIFTALAITASAFIAPAAASAACADPSIKVTATPSITTEGTTVNASYGFCYNTNGAKYTVQVVEVIDGVDTPRTTKRVVKLDGKPGEASGAEAFTPDHAGRYKVIVEFFRDGQPDEWETKGEVVVKANPAPPVVITENPKPVPTPEPTPVPTPTTTPVIDQPAEPVAKVAAPEQARIAIVKRAAKRKVKAGGIATFTITVKNAGTVTANNVIMCDALPAKTQYVSASRTVEFKGAKACFKLGNIKVGQSVKTTLRLSIDRGVSGKVNNIATATADNAAKVTDSDYVKVPRAAIRRVHAPVTG